MTAQKFIEVRGIVTVRGEQRDAVQGTDGIMRYMAGRSMRKASSKIALTFRKTPEREARHPAPFTDAERATSEPTALPPVGTRVKLDSAPIEHGTVTRTAGHALGVDMRDTEVLVTWDNGSEQVVTASRLMPAIRDVAVTPGTVKRGNRSLVARHIRTTADNGTVAVMIDYKSPVGGKWLPASKTAAATFTGDVPVAPVLSIVPEAPAEQRAAVTSKARAAGYVVAGTYRDPANARANFAALASATTGKARRFWSDKATAVKVPA